MIDLKLPKRKKGDKNYDSPVSTLDSERDAYPYGTRLCFEEDQVEKLKLDSLPDAETEVTITAKGYVSRASSNKSMDGTRRSIEIQVTGVDLKFAGNVEAKEAKRVGALTSPD